MGCLRIFLGSLCICLDKAIRIDYERRMVMKIDSRRRTMNVLKDIWNIFIRGMAAERNGMPLALNILRHRAVHNII